MELIDDKFKRRIQDSNNDCNFKFRVPFRLHSKCKIRTSCFKEFKVFSNSKVD